MSTWTRLTGNPAAVGTAVSAQHWTGRTTALLLCVLILSSVVIVRGIHVGEFSYNVDETQHAVTGLFVADLIRDHPFAHPVALHLSVLCAISRAGGRDSLAAAVLLRRRAVIPAAGSHCGGGAAEHSVFASQG